MDLVELIKTVDDFKNKHPGVPTKINMKKSYAERLREYCSHEINNDDKEPTNIGLGFVGNFTGIPIHVDNSIEKDFEVVVDTIS